MADVVHSGTPTHGDGHAHGHPPHLAHHFDTEVQQFDAGKLGMWLFLATEVLLFGGLFCAYAIYRRNHPEVFEWAHQALNTELGALNTVILLLSSFTMAAAVSAAQRGKKNLLCALLALTFLGGVGFMVIKGFEYTAKFEHGFLWGTHLDRAHAEESMKELLAGHEEHTSGHAAAHEDKSAAEMPHEAIAAESHAAPAASEAPAAAPKAAASAPAAAANVPPEMAPIEPSQVKSPPPQPTALAHAAPSDEHGGPVPENVHWFFGIYFAMTGLHGVHVLAGMAVIAWLFVRARRGDFSAEYFTPVDLGGLYWHLVDLIWIYLFPLLYLIR